jgi:hypothetical protein
MKQAFLIVATLSVISLTAATQPVQAGGNGGAVAAGVLGGLAVGAIVGGAAAQPRYYAPPPAYVYEPEPVYAAPHCYYTRGEPVWDAYRGVWMRPRIHVCD